MTYPVLIRTDTYAAGSNGVNALVGSVHTLYEKVGNTVTMRQVADPTTVDAAIPRRIEVKTEGLHNEAVAPSPSLGTVNPGRSRR